MKCLGLFGYWLMLLMLVALFTKALPVLAAEDPMNGPWDSPVHRSAAHKHDDRASGSITSGFFSSLLTFFSAVISPVDGDRCPSYPTCAAYSKEAYQKHGAFVGTLMTVDRLFHEADEHRFSPTVKVYGVHRIYDPVSANEVWKREP
jgi:putative component of membrane protein insertase Oxa1/YidC/SpoIIIJ protein YidD